jgi:proline iminopeptidase
MASVEANGITIEYESLGDPSDPTILLVMGLGMQLVAWPDAMCQSLVEHGFRVVRFDNRDAGLSTRVGAGGETLLPLALAAGWLGLPVRAPYSLDDMAADTVGLMDALGIERAHVVGASLGGMIAQVVAARHRDRVASLTSLMSASGNRRYWLAEPRATRALLARPAAPGDVESVVDHLVHVFTVIGSPGFPTDPDELRRNLGHAVRRAHDRDATARQLLAIVASGDRRELLRQITAPSLVIHGDADPLIRVGAGRDTARNISGAKLLVVEGMGHDLAPGLRPILVDAIASHCTAAL